MTKLDTWTVTAELTVFAGNMDKKDVMANADALLDTYTDGTDFVAYRVIDAKRNEY